MIAPKLDSEKAHVLLVVNSHLMNNKGKCVDLVIQVLKNTLTIKMSRWRTCSNERWWRDVLAISSSISSLSYAQRFFNIHSFLTFSNHMQTTVPLSISLVFFQARLLVSLSSGRPRRPKCSNTLVRKYPIGKYTTRGGNHIFHVLDNQKS